MPNPFPGMNPYLEKTSIWQGFHNSLAAHIADVNTLLPPNYAATPELRIFMEDPEVGYARPDVVISDAPTLSQIGITTGSLAVDEPLLVISPEEYHEAYVLVSVQDRDKHVEIVTTIEILGPANKIGGEGRRLYLDKQRELGASDVHFLEIDLLRTGQPTALAHRLSIQRGRLDESRQSYHISLKRSSPNRLALWRSSVHELLPRVPVPLLEGDADVPLDLQKLIDNLYDRGRYEFWLVYSDEPETPLNSQDLEWSAQLLRAAGKRQ
jgi:hypothetical protein